MTKETKLAALRVAMTTSERDDATRFHHFTDGDEKTHEEIKSLKDLYLEHYEVRDDDYERFSEAVDIVCEVYDDKPEATEDEAIEEACERASDCASIMTYDRLAYLTVWNEDDVSSMMRDYDFRSIADAAAAWYDREVEQAACILVRWVNEQDHDA